MFYSEETKFLPKQKQTLFYIMLNIQVGRKPKEDVRPHRDTDPLSRVGFGASVRVYLVVMEENIYPLVCFGAGKQLSFMAHRGQTMCRQKLWTSQQSSWGSQWGAH